MDVPLMEMDKDEAKEKKAEYTRAVEKGDYPDTPEGKAQRELDAAAAKGFTALAAGKRVLNVRAALNHAGTIDGGVQHGLPRLAIARADASHVEFRQPGPEHSPRAHFRGLFPTHAGYKRRLVEFEYEGLTWRWGEVNARFNGRWSYRAIVPTIPPAVRPKYCHLSTHCILWEADWLRAPADPCLLRHIAGDLFTVEAEWDLTEVERSLLDHALLRR